MAEPDGALLLLADDDCGVLASYSAILKAASFTVLQASDGEEAIAHVRAEPRIQLCLLDVMMPGKTGLEVLALTKLERPTIPIALMSGDPTYEERALESGADAFLAKPAPWDLLLETLSQLLQQ